MLLGFIIPFKPESQSIDWQDDNRLLNRTIHCILSQTNDDFGIWVVYTDEPLNKIQHEKVSYIQYPDPFRYYDEIPDADKYFHLFKRKLFMARFYDKGKKVTYGCEKAKAAGCDYLMCVDSDDLISNRIVEFVKQNNRYNKADGWYIPYGYIWEDGSPLILRQSRMQNVNGSTHIIRQDIVWVPDWSSTDWSDYSLFAAHGWIVSRLKEHFNKTLEPIPFRGVIYVAHKNNDSQIKQNMGSLSLKTIAKKILRGRLLSRKIKDEFSLINQ